MGPFAGYLLLGGSIAVLLGCERLWPASATQRGEWLTNATALVLTLVSQFFLARLIAIYVTQLVNGAGGGFVDLRPLGWGVGAVVFLLAMDLGEYLFHRAQHAIPWLWAMHSLHHSDSAVNVTTAERHYWLEPVIKAVSIWPAVALLFKVDGAILAVYAVATTYNLLNHTNVRLGFGPLSWLLNSPQYHRLHHSREARHYNANFAALFPVFDVIAGSYRMPERGECPATGLDVRLERPLQLITWPVRSLFRGSLTPGP
jgi:sterol desaturase/sphingolipid hydroxylase (fatty acid hydroxylase superfamily)